LEAQIIAIYDSVGPAVVNVTNRSYAYDMFLRPVLQEGSGSGFLYDTGGHIVTNYHVIENVDVTIIRDGQEQTISVTLGGRP